MKIDLSILNAPLENIESFISVFNPKDTILHMDIMDGVFVKEHSFSKSIVDRCSKYNKEFIIDTHLMVNDVEKYINEFKDTNSTYLTFHFETGNIKNRIDLIHKYNKLAGLSIKPNTKVEELIPYLDIVDQVLVMSVEPGLGGQKFMDSSIDKLKFLKEYKLKHNLNYIINVDGGINKETIIKVKDYVDYAVVGSFITKSESPIKSFNDLKSLIE